jgi:CheY-like chemotaxis protein
LPGVVMSADTVDTVQPGGEKVLVVDDVPQNVKLMRLILKNEGYQVIEANSGAQALTLLKQENPAAIILDVRMPGMSGYEVCEEVRKLPGYATLPIIMVTALTLPEERIRGIECGATAFITKPFNKKELIARLKSGLLLAGKSKALQGVATMANVEDAVVIARPDWSIAAASSSAIKLLALGPEHFSGESVLHIPLLRDVVDALSSAPLDAPMSDMPAVGDTRVKHTPVSNNQNELILRVISLTKEKTSGYPAD